jgi:hypothetical protein
LEEARTEQSRIKKAERTRPNDNIYKRNKAKLITLLTARIWPNSFKEQSRKGCSLKKPLKKHIKISY